MPGFEILEERSCWLYLPLLCVLQTLADALRGFDLRDDVEQALVSFGVLHDGLGLPLHGENYGALGLFELLHEVTRPAAERCQRLDVFGDVKHGVISS